MRQIVLLVSLALVALGLAACGATSATEKFTATLNGANERPNPVTTTTATGSATLELKDKTMTLKGTYTGLSGAAMMAHIHGPAAESGTAAVLFPLTFTEGATAGSGTLSGTATLTDAQITELKAGQWYVNLHTGNNPGGEVRGQLK
jgi:ABC-type amino acid transport substrate-binding protein